DRPYSAPRRSPSRPRPRAGRTSRRRGAPASSRAPHLVGRVEHRLDDRLVAGAAADVALHPLPHLGHIRLGMRLEERLRRDDHAAPLAAVHPETDLARAHPYKASAASAAHARCVMTPTRCRLNSTLPARSAMGSTAARAASAMASSVPASRASAPANCAVGTG